MSGSSPFPLEEQAQLDDAGTNGVWNPWQGEPKPGFFTGMGFDEDTAYLGPMYRALEAAGEGAAKGEELLGGMYHGLMEGEQAVGRATGSQYLQQDAASGLDEAQAVERDAQMRVKAMTPDPATTGTAVQLLHGVVSGAYRVTAGALLGGPLGGAALLGGSEAVSRYNDLTQQGVSSTAAAESAAGTGVLQAAGALMPGGFGSSLISRLATGAGANVAAGVASRYLDHAVLDANGYHAMADQERVWDRTQLISDAILGAAFGGMTHLHARGEALAAQQRMLEATRNLADASGGTDAARVMEVAGADRRAAPGIPADPQAAAAHQAALEKATSDLLAGQPVSVADTGIDEAQMLARPEQPGAEVGRQVIADAFSRAGIGDAEGTLADLEAQLAARMRGESVQTPAPTVSEQGVTPGETGSERAAAGQTGLSQVAAEPTEAPSGHTVTSIQAAEIPRAPEGDLSPADRAIEARFAEQLAGDYPEMEARYAQLPDSEGGKVLNTDTARELSADYMADRTRSAAVHEPASWLIKRLYAEKLTQPPGPGEEPYVLFTGGGTGAGKSTAIKGALGDLGQRAQIVMDSNMNGLKSSITKIDQALAAGKDVRIVYVYRHPVESLVHGALTRAMHQEARFGSGRTVPIKEHLKTHLGSNEAIRQIAEHYEGNKHVDVTVLDNSRGKGNVRVIDLSNLPHLDYNEVREQAHQALQSEFEAGRISPAVYRGFAGHEPGEPAGPAGPSGELRVGRPTNGESAGLGAATRGQPEPQRPGGNTDQLTGAPASAGTHTVMTATGRRIEVAPKLAELSDLVTSDQEGYPSELQPRQRGARAALTEQVRGIARNLNPELLGNAPEADRGAPITGPGNVVESGNGRALALRQVYAEHPEKAAEYRAFLERQGYDTAGMKQPVLVRERVTPLEGAERRAFTVEANQTSVASLSPVERAQADARLLDASSLSQLRSGDVATAQNAPFVRGFLAQLPEGERNALVNPDGTISQEGVRRVQAAILAKAYGGAPESNVVLGRMLESTDNDMRSTLGALLDAAPAFARLRQAIEDGKIGAEYDLSKAITQAVEAVAHVREKGQALSEFLKQEDFLSRRPAVVDALMRALYDKRGERMAGRDAVATRLMDYADRAIKQRLDQGMLFGDPPVSPERLLEAREATDETPELKPGADMFGLRTPQGSPKASSKPSTESVARQVIERNPNMEIPDETGEPQRARAELMAADDGVEKVKQRAEPAVDAAATCFSQRPAA